MAQPYQRAGFWIWTWRTTAVLEDRPSAKHRAAVRWCLTSRAVNEPRELFPRDVDGDPSGCCCKGVVKIVCCGCRFCRSCSDLRDSPSRCSRFGCNIYSGWQTRSNRRRKRFDCKQPLSGATHNRINGVRFWGQHTSPGNSRGTRSPHVDEACGTSKTREVCPLEWRKLFWGGVLSEAIR